jgi:hypothetical protein
LSRLARYIEGQVQREEAVVEDNVQRKPRVPAGPRSAVSARIAERVRQEMARRGIDRNQLVERIEQQTGRRHGRQWLSRTLNGGSHLTVPRPSEVPNDLLREIASAIDPQRGPELAVELAKLDDE